ncbi:MAG: PqqD family peptide modification chaperone [Sulfurovaceae bacterium]|nr:PqqD family peptide modification chaperone [Sulfurovaceae bacterium]
MLTPQAKIKRIENIIASPMDDELVMMSMENNAYYGLNKVGRKIWELLESEQTLDTLCDELLKQYDVDRATCYRDILVIVSKMEEAGLVAVE